MSNMITNEDHEYGPLLALAGGFNAIPDGLQKGFLEISEITCGATKRPIVPILFVK